MSPTLAFAVPAFWYIANLILLPFMVGKPRDRLTGGSAAFSVALTLINLWLTYSLYLGATS